MLGQEGRAALCVFFKERSPDYEEEALQKGYAPHFVPTLAFDFCNQEELESALFDNEEEYEGLIVTSQTSVEALRRVFEAGLQNCRWRDIVERWQKKRCFVVGAKTNAALQSLLGGGSGEHTISSQTLVANKADELARLMIAALKENPQQSAADTTTRNSSLLFVCGNIRQDTLPQALRDAAIPFHEVRAYCTETAPTLANEARAVFGSSSRIKMARGSTAIQDAENEEGLAKGTKAQAPSASHRRTWLCFFSPSGVKAVHAALQPDQQVERGDEEGGEWLKFAAIGETTANQVEKTFERKPEAVAEAPNAKAMIEAIYRWDEQHAT